MVLFHVVTGGVEVLSAETVALNLLRFGHEAVVIFIVLSGFVLTLPLAPAPRSAGGVGNFLRRRARRILPGYYASLLMMPLFFLVIEGLKELTGEGSNWARIQAMFFSADMLAHVFLLHNLSEEWVGSINPVLWSLSTEWWVYFVFAFVLLPLWRRHGIATAVCLSILIGLIPAGMTLSSWPTLAGSPHLLGAFGLGMMSAVLLSSRGDLSQVSRLSKLCRRLALTAFVMVNGIVFAVPTLRLFGGTRWVTDLLIAIVCAACIYLLASTSMMAHSSHAWERLAVRILESRPLLFLGRISYSLYLTHLNVWSMLGITLGLGPVQRLIPISIEPMSMRVSVLLPMQVLFAYGFYLVCERPFLNQARSLRVSGSE